MMNVSQWHMHRMGLVDFWCYENDELYFSDGHMLLRGSNGSGKSVTMQSFIPLLLDGNRSSERLDPFGTRSRKMETYLIDENSDRDERIGYLYLEFKREDSELYQTIGMGIRARRNKPLDVWYFVIEDNRRVNIDFSLMSNHLTLSKKQLENILGDQVITGQGEYMRKVNETLFGFSHVEDYKDAIDLLLQLRSPKLSNSLSPSKINEILATSLQPLSEEDLRPMSDAITSMDNLQDDLENLNNCLVAANKIAQAYHVYNQVILIDKWNKYQRENEAYQALTKEIHNKEQEIQRFQEEYTHLKEELSQNQIQLEVLTKEKNILADPRMERLHDELMSLKKHIQDLQQQILQKEKQRDFKEEKIIDLKNDIEHYENKIYKAQKDNKQAFQQLDEIYDIFPFSEHSALKETLLQHHDFEFDYTKRRLKEEQRQTQNVLSLYDRYDQQLLQIQHIENEMMSFHEQLEDTQQALEESKKQYANCIVEYQEYFYKYNNQNTVLKLSHDDLLTMTNLLSDFEITKDYHSIFTLVHHQYMKQYEAFTKEKGLLQLERHKSQEAYDHIDQEYQSILQQKDFEPVRDDLTKKSRQYLNSCQIAYIPFFKLLDFAENIDEEEKKRTEEILLQMHLLDALVIEEKYQQQLRHLNDNGHDYYLWTKFSLQDLTSVTLEKSLDTQQLSTILEALGIENKREFIIEKTYFQSGLLEGNIDQSQSSVYIGFQRRQLLRQQKIDELSKQLTQTSLKIQDIDQHISKIEQNLPLLKQEMDAFRDDSELREYDDQIERHQKNYTYLENKIDQLFLQKEKEMQKSQVIYQDIKKQCQDLFVEVSKEALQSRQEVIEDYEVSLDHLKDALAQESHYQKLLDIEQDKLSELQSDTDQLKYEISTSYQQKQIDEGKAQSIQNQLDEQGYTDKQKKLEDIENQMNVLQEQIRMNISQTSKIEERQSHNQEMLEQIKGQSQKQEAIQKQYYDVLLQDVHYGFVYKDDDMMEKNLKKLSKDMHVHKSVSEYLGTLQAIFFEQASYLSQYHLSYEVDALCCELDDVSGHFLMKANHQGQKIPFLDLLEILQQRIDAQKLLIVEEDRHIFEEILVNTIGRKIRNRIQASQRWVEKMERYMHDMNTSSGLQLGLKWNSKKALDNDELDTKKLVELLEKDYRVLKESDRQKISQHFRSKIEAARRMSLDENTSASFHQLMKDVMDYRKWFEFTLYAKKPNENRKELTNRIFFSYSGGEKAIAMYVPLFSAVAAKFESARADAPHLIALDEAFAGVDENNIDNMFALITKFNFDYIMNSQVLWGDYPSCKSLAIYELFRPNNAPFVTKVAYHWNGHVRKVKNL